MASDTITGLIQKSLHKYQAKHDQLLTSLLRCAPEALSFFSRLLDTATRNEDFEVSDRRKLVHHQSFFKCLTEVLQAICTTFTFASDNIAEIQCATLQLQESVVNLVHNDDNKDECAEAMKAMSDTATIGVSLASQIRDKFQLVHLMLEELTMHFTVIKGTTEGDPANPVEIELLQTTKKFQYIESSWTEIVDLLVRVDSGIKADLVEESSAKSRTRNIAKHAVGTTSRAALVSTIVTGYYEMSKKYLNEPVAEFCKVEAGTKYSDEFTRLENKFWDMREGIEQLINTARDSWSEKIFEKLKQGFSGVTEEQREKFEKLMALYERTNEMVKNQGKLEQLLVSAPRSIQLLSDLCLISKDTKNYELHKPLRPFNHVQYEQIKLVSALLDEIHSRMVDEHGKLEVLLHSSPEGIRLLGELCLVSTKYQDFQLYKPLRPFNHVKYDRFRACLHQVVNRGSDSFTTAHKELRVIETNARDIQALVVDIVELILQGEPEDIQETLPGKLKYATTKGSECGKKSAEVEKKFDDVILLVNELSETLTATRSETEKKVSESIAASTQTNECQEVIIALRDGLFILIEVRKQWTLLTNFFSTLANNMVKIQLDNPMDRFTATASVAGENGINKNLSSYARGTLQAQAIDIASIAFQVNMICTMYLQISTTHLLEPLSKVDELLALTDAEQIKVALDAISKMCNESQKAIKESVAQSRTKLLIEYRKRMNGLTGMCIEEGLNCEKEDSDCDEDSENEQNQPSSQDMEAKESEILTNSQFTTSSESDGSLPK